MAEQQTRHVDDQTFDRLGLVVILQLDLWEAAGFGDSHIHRALRRSHLRECISWYRLFQKCTHSASLAYLGYLYPWSLVGILVNECGYLFRE